MIPTYGEDMILGEAQIPMPDPVHHEEHEEEGYILSAEERDQRVLLAEVEAIMASANEDLPDQQKTLLAEALVCVLGRLIPEPVQQQGALKLDLERGGARMATLLWVLNPSHFGGISLRSLAALCGRSKSSLSSFASEFSNAYGIVNRGQINLRVGGHKHRLKQKTPPEGYGGGERGPKAGCRTDDSPLGGLSTGQISNDVPTATIGGEYGAN